MFNKLHPVTWLLIAVAVAHLVGDVTDIGTTWTTLVRGEYDPAVIKMQAFGHTLRTLALGLSYFGMAATVEFLARIWRELQLQRLAKGA